MDAPTFPPLSQNFHMDGQDRWMYMGKSKCSPPLKDDVKSL